MIKIYCNGKHHSKQLCAECQELLNYAQLRLERCKFGNQKHTCKKMPRSLLQALYATKDVRGHALRGPSHAMAPPHCRHTAYAKSLTEMV